MPKREKRKGEPMTLNGAIMQLVELRESSMMPEALKPCFDKVIETISECEEPSAQPEHDENDLDFVQPHKRIPVQLVVSSDCISRRAAIDAVGNMLRRKFGVGGDLAEITIAGLPSVQPERCEDCGNFNKTRLLIPQPQRTGKWIRNPDDTAGSGYFICSECKMDFYDVWKYCPNCGCRMTEEKA